MHALIHKGRPLLAVNLLLSVAVLLSLLSLLYRLASFEFASIILAAGGVTTILVVALFKDRENEVRSWFLVRFLSLRTTAALLVGLGGSVLFQLPFDSGRAGPDVGPSDSLLSGEKDEATRAELHEAQSRLVVLSEPRGAEIYVNGAFKGLTNRTLLLSQGEFSLELRMAGYVPHTTIVEVPSDSILSVVLRHSVER